MLTNFIEEVKNMTATVTGVGITSLGQIQIRTHDVERAAAFYENILGLKLLFKAPPGLAFFDCGGVRLMLDRPEKQEFDHASSILYFAVPDIQAAHARMKAQSVKFEDEPHMIARMPNHDLWMTFFRDSEDNLLALMSEVAR
jgi:methylmalonyl-CoA/ethylmalonyl-CoA epimerase